MIRSASPLATRFATLAAAVALSAAAGFAHAGSQVSQDDFSVLTGPNATQVSHSSAARTPVSRGDSGYGVQANAELEQGLVGPQVAVPSGKLTRAQVIRERELARAQGALEPGYEYLSVAGAPYSVPLPSRTSFAGSLNGAAGQ